MALIPENRTEQILAGEKITPENREEAFLKEAIDNAGSGGGGSLPDMTGQSGKFLTNDGTDASWADVPSGLPDATGASVGDVVTLGSDGAEWAAPKEGATIICTAPMDPSDRSIGTPSMHYSEVLAAIASGKSVVLRITIELVGMYIDYYYSLNVNGQLLFTGGTYDDKESIAYVWFDTNNTITADTLPVGKLVLDGTLSGSDFTIEHATAGQIAAAWNVNQDVIIPMPGFNVKFALTMCDYTDENDFRFEFTTYGISTSTGKLSAYLLNYEDTLTTTVVIKEYEPVANP